MNSLATLFLLIFGHSMAETALQPATMEYRKNRRNPIDMSRVPKGQKPINMWPYFLTHHAIIHGGMVYIATRRTDLALAETIVHWTIDFYKTGGKFSPHVDQSLHILCKIIYVLILL